MLPAEEGGIVELAGLAQSTKTVGLLLRTPFPAKPAIEIQQIVSSVNLLQWKNTLNYFSSNAKSKIRETFQLSIIS
jgi:hypothetical protein